MPSVELRERFGDRREPTITRTENKKPEQRFSRPTASAINEMTTCGRSGGTRQATDHVAVEKATVRCDIDAEHQQSAPEATAGARQWQQRSHDLRAVQRAV